MTTTTVKWNGADGLRDRLVPIGQLKPFPGNARRGNVKAIAESLRRFGQVRAVTVTPDWTIVAGHHVTLAAKQLQWTHIAVIPAEFETRDDARDYLLADNQLQALGEVEPQQQISLMEEVERRGTWEGTGFSPDDLADARALAVHKSKSMEIKELKRHPGNYRDHDEMQLEQLTQSLREHGLYRNIVVARDGTVLAGHGILEAAQKVGLKKIMVTKLDVDPFDPQALKIVAGDNELGRLAGVDERELTELLKHVRDEGDVNALVGSGFDAQSLAALIVVTRPETEVKDHNAAAEWIGLPEFNAHPHPPKLVLSFDNEVDRDKLMADLGLFVSQRRREVISSWYPPREREDPFSLRFDTAEGHREHGDVPLPMEDQT